MQKKYGVNVEGFIPVFGSVDAVGRESVERKNVTAAALQAANHFVLTTTERALHASTTQLQTGGALGIGGVAMGDGVAGIHGGGGLGDHTVPRPDAAAPVAPDPTPEIGDEEDESADDDDAHDEPGKKQEDAARGGVQRTVPAKRAQGVSSMQSPTTRARTRSAARDGARGVGA